jgi:hypothetical protein
MVRDVFGVSPGLLVRGGLGLLIGDDLTGAAEEAGICPQENADADQIAASLARTIPIALNLGLSGSETASRSVHLKHMKHVVGAVYQLQGLLNALGLDRLSSAALDLLRPGLSTESSVSLTLTPAQAEAMLDRASSVGELAEAEGLNPNEVAEEESRAMTEWRNEDVLRDLPLRLQILADVARSACAYLIEQPSPSGRPPDDAADLVLRYMIAAHRKFFGCAPKPRNAEGGRDTPSTRWVKNLLMCAAVRAPVIMAQPSPESAALVELSELSLEALNGRMKAVLHKIQRGQTQLPDVN